MSDKDLYNQMIEGAAQAIRANPEADRYELIDAYIKDTGMRRAVWASLTEIAKQRMIRTILAKARDNEWQDGADPYWGAA